MPEIPPNYQPLEGGPRRAVPGARAAGKAEPGELLSLSICVRGRPGSPPLPGHEHWVATPPAKRKYLSREELAPQYGAAQEDLDRVAAFVQAQGFTVTETSAARRLVKASGTVEMAERAFAVELGYYELDEPRQRYRSHEGAVYIPADLIGIVTGVFGLDNRQITRHAYNGPPPGVVTAMQPRGVAALYGFPLDPTTSNAQGVTVAVLEFNSYFFYWNQIPGFQQNDIDNFVSNLVGAAFNAPQVMAVSIDHEPINTTDTGPPNGPTVETAGDIEMIAAVAQGANVVAYFSQNSEAGWIHAVSYIVADNVNNPQILSISWGGNEDAIYPGFPQQLTQYFQMAAAIGMTVFASSGDQGSNCFATDTDAHVNYPASDPWVTACGGTTMTDVEVPLGMTFKEITWNDSDGATGGGISTQFPQPPWQQGANLPQSVNPNKYLGRGVPDIAGNASGFSGYNFWVNNQQYGPVNGTSSVAPL
jgi:kumamolisin